MVATAFRERGGFGQADGLLQALEYEMAQAVLQPLNFREFWHWIFDQSDHEVGNGNPQRTQLHPQCMGVAKNSWLN